MRCSKSASNLRNTTPNDDRVRGFAEEILQNMARRFGYSSESALDTVLFGLRKKIIDFSEIIS